MNRLITVLNKVLEVIIAVLVAAMVIGNFWQIFTRFVLNDAASWTEEFLRYALIWLTMLGVPYAYGKNQHIAIEFVVDTFSKKGRAVDALFVELVVLAISIFVMIIGGFRVTSNAVGQTSPALGLPMQFYYMCVPVCGILMIIYTLPKLVSEIRVLAGKENR